MPRITLDTKHKQIMRDFRNTKKSLITYKKEYDECKEKLLKLESIPNSELQASDFENRFQLNNKINELKVKIKRIEQNKDEDEYFINVSDLLYQYYDKSNETSNKNTSNMQMMNKKKKVRLITDYFDDEDNLVDNIKETNKSVNNNNMGRGEISDKYLKCVDPSYINDHMITLNHNIDICKNCFVERTIIRNEGILLCDKCHQAERIMITSDRPNPKEKSNTDNCFFTYKRINHFLEWLSQIQAKQTTDIPQDILDKIKKEMQKEKITDYRRLKHEKVRDYLKILNYNKYYEHIPYIIYRITGKKPLSFSRELEEKLCTMFKQIQEPFEKVCPSTRSNFLSYSYVLFKFFELLGLDEYKNKFPLLKSRVKLYEQDIIWRDICKLTRWEYIPSI